MKQIKDSFSKNNILSTTFIILFITCISLCGCVKNEKLYSPEEGNIYMPQAEADRATLSLYKIDSPQVVYFGAAYSGFGTAPSAISATFQVDTSLIDQYNIDNAYLGYTYYALPDSAYTIDSFTTVFKAGSTSSVPLSLTISASKLALGTHYLLPVRLVNVSSGKMDSSLSIAYFKIDTLTIRARDITNQGTTFTYNYNDALDNDDTAETAIHLIDSNYTSKYLLFTYHDDMYAQLQYSTPTVINAYTLTSAGDAEERDPKSWNISASNDGINWTVIDSRTNETFSGRNVTVQYNMTNNDAYLYYRWNVKAINDETSGMFQCAEWRLLQFY